MSYLPTLHDVVAQFPIGVLVFTLVMGFWLNARDRKRGSGGYGGDSA